MVSEKNENMCLIRVFTQMHVQSRADVQILNKKYTKATTAYKVKYYKTEMRGTTGNNKWRLHFVN